MASIVDLINPLSWAEKLGGLAATLVVLGGAAWYVDHRLEKHYTAKVSAEIHGQYEAAKKDAHVLQRKASDKATTEFKSGQAAANKVLDQKLIEVTAYAKTLPEPKNGVICPADPEFMRLYNGGRTR